MLFSGMAVCEADSNHILIANHKFRHDEMKYMAIIESLRAEIRNGLDVLTHAEIRVAESGFSHDVGVYGIVVKSEATTAGDGNGAERVYHVFILRPAMSTADPQLHDGKLTPKADIH